MTKKLCLVTGGAGFIGSHLVDRLLKEDCKVRVLDNLVSGKRENMASFLDQIEFMEEDIRNPQMCLKACEGVDTVFHEAALGSVPRSIEDPLTTHEVNITGTLHMLNAARAQGVRRFIFASSSSVYGDSPSLPKIESMPVNPKSPYGLSKYAAETYVVLFCQLYGLEAVALRYFNVFGPRQDPHSQYAAVIPRFITRLLKKESPVVYGDGEQARDFTFVADVVAANLLAAIAPKEACGRTYNIACNQRHSLNKLIDHLKTILKQRGWNVDSVAPVYELARTGDIKLSQAGIDLIETHLGFKPATSFFAGLEKTVDYFMSLSY